MLNPDKVEGEWAKVKDLRAGDAFVTECGHVGMRYAGGYAFPPGHSVTLLQDTRVKHLVTTMNLLTIIANLIADGR